MVLEELEQRVGDNLDLRDLVVAVSRIPYGRTSTQTSAAVVGEWRGTCSTKHLVLRDALAERWPHIAIGLWHRPYVVTRQLAASLWGSEAASYVPTGGLVDVHTFARVALGERSVQIDVTVPLAGWDGTSDVPLQSGGGEDIEAGSDPLLTKRVLVELHCVPALREPFIAALTAAQDRKDFGA